MYVEAYETSSSFYKSQLYKAFVQFLMFVIPVCV